MTQFKKMKMRINNPDHSKAVQEWLFEEGYLWSGHSTHVKWPKEKYLFTGTFATGEITCSSSDDNFGESWAEEINVQHLDPHLYNAPNVPLTPAKSFTDKPQQSAFNNMLTNLKHVQKAIEKADNKQQKRLQDRDRMMQKINEMLPEGFVVQCVEDVPTSNSPEFNPEEIVVGSVWECVCNDTIDVTLGCRYTVTGVKGDGSVKIQDDVSFNIFGESVFLKRFKRIS